MNGPNSTSLSDPPEALPAPTRPLRCWQPWELLALAYLFATGGAGIVATLIEVLFMGFSFSSTAVRAFAELGTFVGLIFLWKLWFIGTGPAHVLLGVMVLRRRERLVVAIGWAGVLSLISVLFSYGMTIRYWQRYPPGPNLYTLAQILAWAIEPALWPCFVLGVFLALRRGAALSLRIVVGAALIVHGISGVIWLGYEIITKLWSQLGGWSAAYVWWEAAEMTMALLCLPLGLAVFFWDWMRRWIGIVLTLGIMTEVLALGIACSAGTFPFGDPGWASFAKHLCSDSMPDAALAVLLVPLFRLERRLAQSGPACNNCGYNLTGNVSCVCPECGRATESGPAPGSASWAEGSRR